MTDIYVARSGQSNDVVSQMMDNETYISASEAIEKGFADSLLSADVMTKVIKSPSRDPKTGCACQNQHTSC